MTQRYDVAVAGGGPAGSAAAWQAVQAGARVVVLDKAEFPRDKPCGDAVPPRALSYMQKDDGRVTGVTLKGGERVRADAVIAADGTYSPSKQGLKLESQYNGYSAIAIRAEMLANRPNSDSLEIYLKLRHEGDQLPGYGWVFPLGGGRVNIGLGYVNSYKNWQKINAAQFLSEFLAALPPEWELPSIEELKRSKALQAWRLPMGFTAWPPWRPGVLFAGDALGAARPVSGAGISKALQSGLAAGECAIASLTNGGPDDFTNYTQSVEAAWGREYRRGRFFHKLAGIPTLTNAGLKVLDNVNNPKFRARLLFWEGTLSAGSSSTLPAATTGHWAGSKSSSSMTTLTDSTGANVLRSFGMRVYDS